MERLTDDRFLKEGFYQPKSKEEAKEIRSMGNDLTFEKLYKHCAEVEKQNAELQKQMDELKNRRGGLIAPKGEKMTFKDLMIKLTHNTPIEIYYDDCEYVNGGTVEQIKRMYAFEWFLIKKEIEFISMNDRTNALMITLKRNS